MIIFITVLMLNVWAISADEVLSPNINIIEELGKIKNMETIMKSLETEMERLRTENKELTATVTEQKENIRELRNEMKKKNEEISNLTLSQVELRKENRGREIAFSASLVESGDEYIGPFTTHFTLTYKNVFTNIGKAYNPFTGIFTAPLKGAYMFRVSIYGVAGTAATVSIIKNGEIVVSAYDEQPQGALNSSNGVVLILEVGDVVYVRLKAGRRIYDNENNHSTFSGFLLFPLK
ncbi:complement C1q-like protein 2 [Megalobrama amblycephala]|uniref:complement C1q-like protein 2 n=1 Tax=Megalobrama amblycephala TaxID=75352 RepID=UPI002013D260|nr:complement C1q-like protein 2 [Megalobrama amblycephala]